MNFDKVNKILSETPYEIHDEVQLHMDILDRINFLLEEKFQGKQKLLALAIGKSESEVSKWFSGYQNFTLSTLIKLQRAFGAEIICVAADYNEKNSDFVFVKTQMQKESQSFCVNFEGAVESIYEDAISIK